MTTPSEVWQFPELAEFGFALSMFFSTVLAFVLNYSIFYNTAVNSALTQSVCGQVRALLRCRKFNGYCVGLCDGAGPQCRFKQR